MKACIDGELGSKLQLAAEAETKAARDPLKNVPTVLFNGVSVLHRVNEINWNIEIDFDFDFSLFAQKFDDGLQEKAVKGLRTTLCELLSEKKLESCAVKA